MLWPRPSKILLATYYRLDHLETTIEHSVVGVRIDGKGSASKANQLTVGDWVLIRLSEFSNTIFDHLLVHRPARVTGRAVLQKAGGSANSPWPERLWPEETERSKLVFPFRIPVTFDGGPSLRPDCFTWDSLRSLGLRGANGQPLVSPQQWGIKFDGNILDEPREVNAVVRLIEGCSTVPAAAG